MKVFYTPNQALLDAEYIKTGKRSGPLGLRRYIDIDETTLTPAQRTKILAYERSGMRLNSQTYGAFLLGSYSFVAPHLDPQNGVMRGSITFESLKFYIEPDERAAFEILDMMLIQYERCKELLAKSDPVWQTMCDEHTKAYSLKEANDLVDEVEQEYDIDDSERELRPPRELLWTLVEILTGKQCADEHQLNNAINGVLRAKE